MALIYEIENRQVIPNWRDFKRTTAIGELETNWNRIKTSHLNLSRPIQDWKQNKTIGTAADLVSSAFISSDFQSTEVKEAISFILNNKDHASQTLLDLANRVNGVKQEHPNQNKLLELDLDSVDDIQNLVNNDRIFKYMGIVKRRAYSELKNPIQWVELSRLYSMFNHEDKAEQAMVIAINLAPNNRYVVRSATRLFIHIHKYEKALYYLKKSQLLKGDPWVISAHIATSDLMNRYSPHLKKGIELIDSKNFSDYDLTELSSAICTFEYHNGTAKKN